MTMVLLASIYCLYSSVASVCALFNALQVTNSSASVDEAALGGTGGCTTLFLSCVSALQKEPIIQRSPRGKKVHELLRYVEEKREEV